jgi:hypothetical protein
LQFLKIDAEFVAGHPIWGDLESPTETFARRNVTMPEVLEQPVSTKTEVFTADELTALRIALNKGKNGIGGTYDPPSSGDEVSDDWRNDTELLVKFLRDLNDILAALIPSRLPAQHHKRFNALLKNLKPNIDQAIGKIKEMDDPKHTLFDQLDKLGLLGDSLLAKLDAFRDRVTEGPVVGVLEMGDTILDSLIAAIELLEPLKEIKDTIKNQIEFGADGGILKLGLYTKES